MQQLSPMDAAFLYLENETTHAHGTLVWLYDASDCDPGSINRRALLDHMRSRLHVSPIFTRKVHRLPLDFDYPYWVDDPAFELLYHVRELLYPQTATGATSASWCRGSLPATGPRAPPVGNDPGPRPGRYRGLPERCFAILGKFHHVAIDGATGMHIIEASTMCPGSRSSEH